MRSGNVISRFSLSLLLMRISGIKKKNALMGFYLPSPSSLSTSSSVSFSPKSKESRNAAGEREFDDEGR